MPEDIILTFRILDYEVNIYETNPIQLGEERTLSWAMINTKFGSRTVATTKWNLKTGLQDAVDDVTSRLNLLLR